MTEHETAYAPMTAAERMRLSRDRRRQGLMLVQIEIRTSELAAMIRAGLLAEGDRTDPICISAALGLLLDRWTEGAAP